LVGKVGGVDEQSKIGNDNSIWLIFWLLLEKLMICHCCHHFCDQFHLRT
jgi:hypothetical protein